MYQRNSNEEEIQLKRKEDASHSYHFSFFHAHESLQLQQILPDMNNSQILQWVKRKLIQDPELLLNRMSS